MPESAVVAVRTRARLLAVPLPLYSASFASTLLSSGRASTFARPVPSLEPFGQFSESAKVLGAQVGNLLALTLAPAGNWHFTWRSGGASESSVVPSTASTL